jgi:hypothetical protein
VLAIKAYLFTLPAIRRVNAANALNFPFNQRWILFGWKWLNLHEGEYVPNDAQSPAWNHGAYLVELFSVGLGPPCLKSDTGIGVDYRRLVAIVI